MDYFKSAEVLSFSRENLGPLLRSVRFHQLVTCWWGKGHWSAPLTDLFCSGSRSPHVQVCTLSLGAEEDFFSYVWVTDLTSAPFQMQLFGQDLDSWVVELMGVHPFILGFSFPRSRNWNNLVMASPIQMVSKKLMRPQFQNYASSLNHRYLNI